MISIVTTCMGRREHLEKTLGPMLNQEAAEPVEVVVVDYSCPQAAAWWAKSLQLRDDQRLTVVEYRGATEFNRCHSRNLGARHSEASTVQGSIIIFLDADAIVQPTFAQEMADELRAGASLTLVNWTDKRERGVGVMGIHASSFYAARGWDEGMEGWGWEDVDFGNRVIAKTTGPIEYIDGSLIQLIRHSEEHRTAFHAIKNRRVSRSQNRKRGRDKDRPINPLGFGLMASSVWHSWKE